MREAGRGVSWVQDRRLERRMRGQLTYEAEAEADVVKDVDGASCTGRRSGN